MNVILCDSPSWRFLDPRMHCSLSTIYLAASVRAAGHDVRIVDAHALTSWDGNTMTVHKDQLPECDILGMSATTANVNFGSAMAKEWPAKVKILGGRHCTDILDGRQEIYKHPKYFKDFHYIAHGECEESLVEFINSGCQTADGFFKLIEDTLVPLGQPHAKLPEITKLPTPAFELWEAGYEKGGMRNHVGLGIEAGNRLTATLYHARGCPFGCRFCSDARTPMRTETLEQVAAQAKLLKSIGVGAVRIADDVFTIREQRAMDIADIMYDHGLLFRGTTRVNLKSPKLFQHLAKKGATELGFGVEHGSAFMLKKMDKGTTPQANEDGIKMCQDAGICAAAFVILGFPGETNETIDEVKKWLLKVKPDIVRLSIFQPYPGTAVYNFPEQFGVTLPENCFDKMWQFENNHKDNYVLDLPTITREDLKRGVHEVGQLIEENIASMDRRADCSPA